MEKNQHFDIDELLAKYMLGQCTDEELALIEQWGAESEKNRHTLSLLKSSLTRSYPEPTYINAEAMKAKILARSIQRSDQVEKPRRGMFGWLIAASVAVALVVVGLLADWPVADSPAVAAAQTVEKYNPAGVRSRIQLPDGTTVWLNSASRLFYTMPFTDSVRSVTLEGEAYFDVQRDTLRPFVVQAGAIETRVLGTAFNIRSYPGQPQVKVAVTEGKVRSGPASATQGHGAAATLVKGEMLTYHAASQEMEIGSFDPSEEIGWTERRIVFKEASMSEIVDTLERWYGVTITVQGEVAQATGYTATFQEQNINEVLLSMSYSIGFAYTYDARSATVKITGKTAD